MAKKDEQKTDEIVNLLRPSFDKLMQVGRISRKDMKTNRKTK